MIQPYAERTNEKMMEVLMNAEAKGPRVHYHMIRGGSDKGNITVWESGTIGGEYIKSYGHYHVGKLDETYEILSGEGFVLMQRRKTDALGNPLDDEIDRFEAIRVTAGSSVFIPSGTGHLAVNTGSTWLVTRDDSPVNFEEEDPAGMPGHADYAPFKKLRGAAYYVVQKDGAAEFVRNPLYKTVPEIDLH
ncbi:MAG: glucose-6-phosphate isomerase family protein [Candidatus Paceibacterota bacterium]|jgi:oxalate decarboxylase/phosphoglucose isomerase-like protein (cupin superfamily)